MRKPIIAPEGMRYTDHKEIYAKVLFLAEGLDKNDYSLITVAEYEAIMAAEEVAT